MPDPLPVSPDFRIFEWLGTDSESVPYYLHALNLVWSAQGAEHDLQVYRRVAELLAGDAAYWATIIRENNWRYSLAGCVCLLASRRREFFDDLCCRFGAGSYVVPQIGVTLGLLHGAAARGYFESVLDSPKLRRNPSQAMSAYRVLLRLGAQPPHQVLEDEWSEFERDSATVAAKVVGQHWEFWSSRF